MPAGVEVSPKTDSILSSQSLVTPRPLPDQQMPAGVEVSPKTDSRGLRYLFHLQCFAEAHASSIWAVSSAMPAQPPLGSTSKLWQLHRSLPPLGFLHHLLHPLRLIMDY